MRKLILIALVLALSGCCIHYQNSKSIRGSAGNIKTPYGNVDDTKVMFRSTLDVWVPWKTKEVTK